MQGVRSSLSASSESLWRRRNQVEDIVRRALNGQPGLRIFGIGIEREGDARGELFVTLTAANDDAREYAAKLLNGCSGLGPDDWSRGWRRLQLGDWMIRVYPERGQA